MSAIGILDLLTAMLAKRFRASDKRLMYRKGAKSCV